MSLTCVILRATGFRNSAAIIGASAVLIVLGRDGTLRVLGPLSFQPAIPVMLAVPMLLSVGIGIAHSTWRSPVVRINARVRAARCVSFILATALACGVVGLGEAVSARPIWSGLLRNTLEMGGACLAAAALLGVAYVWVPAVLMYSLGLLTPYSESAWTPYGLLFFDQAAPGQILAAGAAFVLGLCVGVWDPVSRGYLATVGR